MRPSALGLVTRVVAPEALLDEARGVAEQIASKGPVALREALASIYRAQDVAAADALAFEAERFGALAGTADMKEGMGAFLEKRSPTFTRALSCPLSQLRESSKTAAPSGLSGTSGMRPSEVPPEGVALVGANAQGKTNFLEAIHYLEMLALLPGLARCAAHPLRRPLFRLEGDVRDSPRATDDAG
jgi:hypothetical protein